MGFRHKLSFIFLGSINLYSFCFATGVGTDAAQIQLANEISTSLKTIGTKAQSNKTTANTKPDVIVPSGAAASTLEAIKPKVLAQVESCASKTQIANTMCLETTSPEIGSFMSKYGALMQGAGQVVGSIAGQCSDVGKAISAANIALGAFQAACATAQSVCQSSCGALEPLSAEYKALAEKAVTAQAIGASIDAENANQLVSKAKQAVANCAKYSVRVENAVAGGVLALTAFMQTKNCEEKTSDAGGGINCNDSKNPSYNSKACMCTRNELPAAECQGMGVALSGGVKAPPIAAVNREGTSVGGEGGGPDLGSDPTSSSAASIGGNAGGIGAPMGGGNGASGGGSPAGAAQDGVSNPRRVNTNIIGGYGGGGGGGGFGPGRGFGEVDEKLLKQANEKSRDVASQAPAQITGQAGRSNWEKVKSRYIDNTNRLITSPR